MKTFLLIKDGEKQTFLTPSVQKVYSNKEYKVYKSYFEGDTDYLIVRKSDNKVAFNEELGGVKKLEFVYSIHAKF